VSGVIRLRLLTSVAALAAALVLTPASAFAQAAVAAGTVEGTLTTAAGAPAAGVRVVVVSPTPKNDWQLPFTTTDESGHYTLAPLPAGRYRIGFHFPETLSTQWVPGVAQERLASWITVRSAETTIVDQSLFATGGLDISLRSSDGSELVQSFCLEAIGDYYVKSACTTTGTLQLTDLPAGSYLLMVETDGKLTPEFADVTEDVSTAVEVQQR
jgi:hypothetical protein